MVFGLIMLFTSTLVHPYVALRTIYVANGARWTADIVKTKPPSLLFIFIILSFCFFLSLVFNSVRLRWARTVNHIILSSALMIHNCALCFHKSKLAEKKLWRGEKKHLNLRTSSRWHSNSAWVNRCVCVRRIFMHFSIARCVHRKSISFSYSHILSTTNRNGIQKAINIRNK